MEMTGRECVRIKTKEPVIEESSTKSVASVHPKTVTKEFEDENQRRVEGNDCHRPLLGGIAVQIELPHDA